MFLFGGCAGIILYFMRKKMVESVLYLCLEKNIKRGNILQIFNSFSNIMKFIRLSILITPFYFLITVMFAYPKFMAVNGTLANLISTFLTGFFIGNFISVGYADLLTIWFKDYRKFLFLNAIIFVIAMSIFPFVTNSWFIYYAVVLGLLGGGLPPIWAQIVTRSYGTNLRCTATNLLNAGGRGGAALYNLLISYWIATPHNFIHNAIITVFIITIITLIAIYKTENNYNNNMDYIEK